MRKKKKIAPKKKKYDNNKNTHTMMNETNETLKLYSRALELYRMAMDGQLTKDAATQLSVELAKLTTVEKVNGNPTEMLEALPTIKNLQKDGGKIILCSHMGKPKGEPKPELSLEPVAARLSELLQTEVKFAASDVVVDENVKAIVASMKTA